MTGFDTSAYAQGVTLLRPEIAATVLGFVLLVLGFALRPGPRRSAGVVALVGLLATAGLVVADWPAGTAGAFPDAAGNPAFVVDGFAAALKLIYLLGAALCVLMAVRFLEAEGAPAPEFYGMVVLSVMGMMFMASGNDFATLYIGLETMALASYILVGFSRTDRRSGEAAIKYFLLGAFASGILLYGISLVYGTTGSFNLAGIAAAIAAGSGSSGLLQLGAILILVGMAFKVAAVPFHMWTPDAYEGAPTPVTAFISTAAKAAAFAMLLRVFLSGFGGLAADWTPLLVVLAAASMTFGNVVAVLQDNVKRMLAYSSIAHAGYMLLGLIAIGSAGGDDGITRHGLTAVVLYLLVYTFGNAGAFALVVALKGKDVAGESVDDFRGLSRTNPWAAFAMLVFLLSLAGIPGTAGFVGKWFLFGATVKAHLAWLAVLAVVNSAISLYYYARVVVAMFMGPVQERPAVVLPAGLGAVLGLAAVATVVIGVYPQPFIRFAQAALLLP